MDDKNLVINTIVIEKESESDCLDWLSSKIPGIWKITNPEQIDYASKGMYWDEEMQKFLPAKPFESWVLDEENWEWVDPESLPGE